VSCCKQFGATSSVQSTMLVEYPNRATLRAFSRQPGSSCDTFEEYRTPTKGRHDSIRRVARFAKGARMRQREVTGCLTG
jgi:hypothetical protein